MTHVLSNSSFNPSLGNSDSYRSGTPSISLIYKDYRQDISQVVSSSGNIDKARIDVKERSPQALPEQDITLDIKGGDSENKETYMRLNVHSRYGEVLYTIPSKEVIVPYKSSLSQTPPSLDKEV